MKLEVFRPTVNRLYILNGRTITDKNVQYLCDVICTCCFKYHKFVFDLVSVLAIVCLLLFLALALHVYLRKPILRRGRTGL